jgi:formate hydrogenlyase subunit 3/multisubunit Na+/H+ antiporter MnhD subunit
MNREVIVLVFPALAAFCIPLGTLLAREFGRLISLTASLAGLVYGLMLLPSVMVQPRSVVLGNHLPPFGINLYFSALSLGIVLLIYAAAALILVHDLVTSEPRRGQFYLLFSLLLLSSGAAVLTGDLFNLFVFLEVMAISSYALVAAGVSAPGGRGALKYLLQGQLAGLLMLAGIGIVYSAAGVLNIGVLAGSPALNPSLAFLAGLLLLLPLLLESKLFPFNTWVAGAYEDADSSIAAALSTMVAAAAALALFRLVFAVMAPGAALGSASKSLHELLLLLGILSVLIGELAAFKEHDLNKVLGFSSAGQLGMIALGISAGDRVSVRGALLLVVSHGLAKLLLFLLAAYLSRAGGSRDWRRLRGLGRRLPWAGGMFALGALALMGMPLTAGFWGKMELLRGLAARGGLWLAGMGALLLGTVLEGVYFMRISHALFEPGAEWGKERLHAAVLASCLLLAAALVVLGVLPGLLGAWLDSAVEELMNPAGGYMNIILSKGAGI